MAAEEPVAVVEGPKGKAEIFEVWNGGRLIEYQVKYEGAMETCVNIGDAYITAGDKVGTKV